MRGRGWGAPLASGLGRCPSPLSGACSPARTRRGGSAFGRRSRPGRPARRRVDLPDSAVEVAGVGVVGGVHRDRLGIVDDGDVDELAECGLDTEADAASAGEGVDVDVGGHGRDLSRWREVWGGSVGVTDVGRRNGAGLVFRWTVMEAWQAVLLGVEVTDDGICEA